MVSTSKNRRTNARLLAVFALLGMLLPARLLFACELMDGKTFNQCCCEESGTKGCAMGGGCDLDGNAETAFPAADDMCCAVSVDEPPSYDSATGSKSNIGVGGLVEPSQPPPVLPPAPIAVPATPSIPVGAFLAASPPANTGPTTLLVTQRFRI